MFLIDLLTLELEVCELTAMVSQQAQEITGLQSTVRSMKTEVDDIKDTACANTETQIKCLTSFPFHSFFH